MRKQKIANAINCMQVRDMVLLFFTLGWPFGLGLWIMKETRLGYLLPAWLQVTVLMGVFIFCLLYLIRCIEKREGIEQRFYSIPGGLELTLSVDNGSMLFLIAIFF